MESFRRRRNDPQTSHEILGVRGSNSVNITPYAFTSFVTLSKRENSTNSSGPEVEFSMDLEKNCTWEYGTERLFVKRLS